MIYNCLETENWLDKYKFNIIKKQTIFLINQKSTIKYPLKSMKKHVSLMFLIYSIKFQNHYFFFTKIDTLRSNIS